MLNQANEANVETSHGAVRESMGLEQIDYRIDKEINTIIEYLQNKNIIEKEAQETGKYIIDEEILLGEQKLKLGRGSYKDGTYQDVYVLEEYTDEDSETTKYKVMYYDKSGEDPIEILDLGECEKYYDASTDNQGGNPPEASKVLTIQYKYQEEGISNVEFSIYKDANCTVPYQKGLKTLTDGTVEMKIPEVGKYYIKLLKSPNGYYDCLINEFEIEDTTEDKNVVINFDGISEVAIKGNLKANGDYTFDENEKSNLEINIGAGSELGSGETKLTLYKIADIDANTKDITYKAGILIDNEGYKIICDNEGDVKIEEKITPSPQNHSISNLSSGIYAIIGTIGTNVRSIGIISLPYYSIYDEEVLYTVSFIPVWERGD